MWFLVELPLLWLRHSPLGVAGVLPLATALELMREQRTTDVRFTDIAKGMGVTPPALYRYFDSRDDLLTALITDAYDELGARVRDAVAEATSTDEDSRLWVAWVAAGQAYRRWASEAPERFALILGMPVAGYVAEEEGPTTEAAKGAMSQLSSLFFLAQAGRSAPSAPDPRRRPRRWRRARTRSARRWVTSSTRRSSRRCCRPGPDCTVSPAWRPTATSIGWAPRRATRSS